MTRANKRGLRTGQDELAERQARAAVALVRLGMPVRSGPRCGTVADPRLRSFIVNWLNPLGADPKRSSPLNSTGFDATAQADATAQGQPGRWTPSSSTPRPRRGGR